MKILEEHIVMLKIGRCSAAMQKVIVVDAGERIVYLTNTNKDGMISGFYREISKVEFDEANERGHEWLCPKWWRKKNKIA